MAGNRLRYMTPLGAGIAGAIMGVIGSAIAMTFMQKGTRKRMIERAESLRQQISLTGRKGGKVVRRALQVGLGESQSSQGRRRRKKRAR